MFLHTIFSPDLISINLEAETKERAFAELVDIFCGATGLPKKEEILEALWEREHKMTTGIKKGVAIPHGRCHTLDQTYGVLGVSRKGVEYQALDGQKVHLLFMILTPQANSEQYLHLLRRIALLLDEPRFSEELKAQEDPQGAYGVLKTYEEHYISSGHF
ncbi:MAG: PTS sugar transporter subunit IIA [Treponema sp.]|nr:PTS sugar transporter subunit IIA [Treponema sp.]